jgi:acyl-CoA reductase-like NAD-dependent aldehyde dehydrogenase
LDATFGEIIPTLEKLLWTIANGASALSPETRESGRISMMSSARVEYHPIGVMGVIVSWNYPIHNVLSPLISALMAGNGCVVKCSEETAWTSTILSKIINDLLAAHEIDTDLVTFCNGGKEAGEALVNHADKIVFIGSPGVGKIVMRTAADTLTPVVLELGGKDAAIVFDDAGAESFGVLMRAALQNNGLNCAGLERVVVQDGSYEAFLEKAGGVYKALRIGTPFEEGIDVGGITMGAQVGVVKALVDDAIERGARVVAGGEVFVHPQYPEGQYFKPTILAEVTKEMRIYHEEVFGPVMLVFRFTTESEAIDIANGTEFGLGSAVFSKDYVKAERVCRQLKAGMSNVNGMSLILTLGWGFNYLCQSLPFGGVGMSGFDRFGGVEGLRGNCNIRSATTDKFKGLRTGVPGIIDYPIKSNSFEFQSGLIDAMYGNGVGGKVAGVGKVVRSLLGLGEIRR